MRFNQKYANHAFWTAHMTPIWHYLSTSQKWEWQDEALQLLLNFSVYLFFFHIFQSPYGHRNQHRSTQLYTIQETIRCFLMKRSTNVKVSTTIYKQNIVLCRLLQNCTSYEVCNDLLPIHLYTIRGKCYSIWSPSPRLIKKTES